ncbi:MAG: hypothetical protein AB7I19_05935 [Planctomycetota bacterium]
MNPVLRVLTFLAGLAAIAVGIFAFTKGVEQIRGMDPLDPAAARAEAEQATAGLLAVAVPKTSLRMDCPRSWTKEPRDQGPLVFAVSTWKGVVNANVVMEPLGSDMTTREYAEASRDTLLPMLRSAGTPADAQALAAADFGGRDGQLLRVVYRVKEVAYPIESSQFFLVDGKSGYTITFTSPQAIAAEFHPLFAAMVRSVKFGGG